MIFYFSGTGNTRWAAETIAQHTGESLVSISDALIRSDKSKDIRFTLAEGERIGFCFPIHGWQPPKIVKQFVERMKIDGAERHYTYAVVTCGDTVGDAVRMFDKQLKRKGMSLASSFSLVMPESYVCLPFMYTDTPEKERGKINRAGMMLKEIAAMVEHRKDGVRNLKTGPTPRLYSYVIGGYFNRFMITDKPFYVDTDLCISCGKCAAVCPTDNITIGNHGNGGKNTPEWKHSGDCTCCLACYHHCPTHAINYGKITRKRGQYYFKDRRKETI